MSTASDKRYTVEECFELERGGEMRHEYVDGVLKPMPGASRQHGKIVKNIIKALDDLATAKQCELHAVDIMTRTRATRYRYPDVVISCAPSGDKYILENPCVIIEVLSDSTSDIDTRKKLPEYTSLASMEQYIMLEQDMRFALVYKRKGSQWFLETFENTGRIDIPSLSTSITLDQIYAGLKFSA